MVKISKLRVRRHFEAEVGQYFAADVVLNFRLVEILIRFDQDLCKNHSTLRAVVPLAMFLDNGGK